MRGPSKTSTSELLIFCDRNNFEIRGERYKMRQTLIWVRENEGFFIKLINTLTQW